MLTGTVRNIHFNVFVMTEREQFRRESDNIRAIMKRTLGDAFEPAMAATAIKILEYQYSAGIETSLSAAISLVKGFQKEGLPTDRIRAASIWWECNNLYFMSALYELFDEG